MTDKFVPTTEEVRAKFLIGSTLNTPHRLGVVVSRFNAWLAERDAEVAAKAWDRAILYIGLNPDLANQFLDTNPYRKAVQS